ncbi:MAG: EcsC family protein [Verrucomicrobiota bacterium]
MSLRRRHGMIARMDKPPIIGPLEKSELRELARAKALLENPRLAIRLANTVGSPLEKGFALLPKGWNKAVNKAAHAALMKALTVALATLGRRKRPGSRELFHKVMAGASGGIGGAFGLAALPVELPLSTTIMLRSIADIARSEGHDLSRIEIKLACLEVFAFGGKETAGSAYWATRAALSQTISEAAAYLAQKGAVRESAPAIARLIAQIAARFGVVVSEEVAAKAVPILGAAGGGIINVIFTAHFQDMARGHFIVMRLEAAHGQEQVRAAYEQI